MKKSDEPAAVITYIDIPENPYLTVDMLGLVTAEMEIYCRAQLNEMKVPEPIIVGIKPFSRRFFIGIQTSNLSVYKSEKGRQVALILSDALNRVKQYPIWLGAKIEPKKEIGFVITPDNKLEIQEKTDFRSRQIHVLWIYSAPPNADEFARMKKICTLANQRLSESEKPYTEIMVDYSNGDHRFLYTGNKLGEEAEEELIKLLRSCADEIDSTT